MQRLLEASSRKGARYRHAGGLDFLTPATHPDQVVGGMMSDAGERFQFEVLPNPPEYDPGATMSQVHRHRDLLKTESDLLNAFLKHYDEELGVGVLRRTAKDMYEVKCVIRGAKEHLDLEKMLKAYEVARRKLMAVRADLELQTPRWFPRSPVLIPKVINHKNMRELYDLADRMTEEQLQKVVNDPWHWFNMPVLLEFPMGELFRDPVTTTLLTGMERPEVMDLTGDEKFNAQGLEGKARVTRPLGMALMLLSKLPEYRGRIITQTIRGKA